METNFKSLIQLLDYFKEETTCKEYLAYQRWENSPVCPHCGSVKLPYITNRGYRCREAGCQKKFSVITGTIYENTKISLRLWFAAIYLCYSHKKGISSVQLASDLNLTQKTAWFMLHRIRQMFSHNKPKQLSGTIQMDETFVGGKNKNRHANKKFKNSGGRVFADKTPVFGMLQEKETETIERPHKNIPNKIVKEKIIKKPGVIKCVVIENTKSTVIQPIIKRYVIRGSIIVTDEWLGYSGLASKFDHQILDHRKYQYVNDRGYSSNVLIINSRISFLC